MIYHGQCHCGKIKFQAEGDIHSVIDCNCSICRKRGYLLWMIPREDLKLLTPKEDVANYQFNKKLISHYFCPECGCAPFGEGLDPMTNKYLAAVNVRCLDGVTLEGLKVEHFDGASL